ncbi:MAG TPA: LacI family DNA-binding transcriptional regulator [Candidatus Limiplasma stercoravium]|nr:LacI family DNA-binding transcriptional regulator [Candidatus Limiplasma stercoravium]
MAVTIMDIAARAETSKSTVSRYLNGGSISQVTANRIRRAIKELEYQPNVNARRLVNSRANAIGIVFDDISNYIYGGMMAGIQSAAREFGYTCLFLSRASERALESESLSLFASSMVDGLILVTFAQRDPQDVRLLRESGLPIVLVGDAAGEAGLPTVDVDNLNGTQAEVEMLIRQGHRRIAYLQGPDNMPAAHSRQRGYLRALECAGIEADRNLIVRVNWTVKDAYRTVSRLVQEQSFTALVGSNASSTYGGLQALMDAGKRVPQDVAVAGFDDDPICEHTRPSITTLSQPLAQMGRIAANQLVSRIRGGPDNVCATYVLPTMMLRETTPKQESER